ncbi:MAG: protein kinase [Gemmatimonadaceae bacterium]|nr:protein kinase [Gemmatimonadaceae bacterium]
MNDVLARLTAALADRYRVIRELGAGGMATVYLAHDVRHDRDVAIKVLHPDLGAALGGERFLTEIRTTARLQHPHILPLLDSGAADGLLYYVMPLVTGETLRARLERERQLPIEDALLIAREVADALHYAHAQNVIHRDVKPENILLQGGHALVADFGIALAVQQAGGPRMTQTGLSLGTPSYMSPEQAMGERTIDARSDIYALGAITYEMLTGEPPFTGATMQAVVAKVLNAEPERPSLTRKTLAPPVERAVLKALAKLPADRFATAAAFADALRDGSAFTASTSEAPSMGGKRARLDGRIMLAAGILLGAVAATALTSALRTSPGTLSTATSKQFTFTGKAGVPALSADGAVLAYVLRECDQADNDGFSDEEALDSGVPCRSALVVQDTGGSESARVIDNAKIIWDVRWLPNGTSMIVSATLDSARRGIFVVPRLGGATRQVTTPGTFDVDPTGDSLLFIPKNGTTLASAFAYILSLATGQATDSLKLPSPEVWAVAWSPNGSLLAINTGAKIFIARRNGALVDSMRNDGRSVIRWTPNGEALVRFMAAPGREDDWVKVSVTRDGHFSGASSNIMPRLQALYRGDFDLARRSAGLAYISGDALADQWVFGVGTTTAMPPRRVTSGTSWYADPAISDDGQTLYFLRGNGSGDNLYRIRLGASPLKEEAVSTGAGAGVGSHSPLSPDGSRIVFQRIESGKNVLYDVATATQRITNRDSAGATWPRRVVPFGASGLAAIGRDYQSLMVLDSTKAMVRTVRAPDSLRVVKHTVSPDGRSAALLVSTPTGSAIGVSSLARWDFRPLVLYSGSLANTTLSWTKDGWVYYGRWEPRGPALYRVNATGTVQSPERVMSVPAQCRVESIIVATGSAVGACVASQYRGDVYLAAIPGLTR